MPQAKYTACENHCERSRVKYWLLLHSINVATTAVGNSRNMICAKKRDIDMSFNTFIYNTSKLISCCFNKLIIFCSFDCILNLSGCRAHFDLSFESLSSGALKNIRISQLKR